MAVDASISGHAVGAAGVERAAAARADPAHSRLQRREVGPEQLLASHLFRQGLPRGFEDLAAQVPVEPDFGENFTLVVYEGDTEVGRVYRDVEGPRYTEYWVLYSNFSFDQANRAGASIQIVAEKDKGYENVEDFLNRVPFPKGSRYVNARCQEFDELP
jgi:hypothetical protein